MGWKEKLGFRQSHIIDAETDEYLKGFGFYEDTLSPRFFGEETANSLINNPDAPCLRLDTEDPDNSSYTMRIFVTATEAYLEVQTSWGSFDRSLHVQFTSFVRLDTIDSVLDKLLDY